MSETKKEKMLALLIIIAAWSAACIIAVAVYLKIRILLNK